MHVCSCTFKNMWTDAYQPACWHSLLLHTLYCCKRHTLDNCLGHNHLQVHSSRCNQDSRGTSWVQRHETGLGFFYNVGLDMCKYSKWFAVTYQLLLCIYLLKCGAKPWRTINTYQTIVSPLSGCVCFPTVSLFCRLPKIEQNMFTYQHAKKQKELARQTSFDPIFRSKLAQKIVLCGFCY